MQEIKYKALFILFTSIIIIGFGALNHFIYEWSGNSAGTAWFAATDESTFQHMKLAFYPWILCSLISIILIFRGVKYINWIKNWSSAMFGFLVTIALIPCFFYIYTQAAGNEHNLTYDIITFVISVILGIIAWVIFAVFDINCQLDRIIYTIILISLIIWFTTCSYITCENIYNEP